MGKQPILTWFRKNKQCVFVCTEREAKTKGEKEQSCDGMYAL